MGVDESFGNSSGPADESAMTAISDFIQKVQPGSFVQKFVLIVETIDEDDRWLSAFTAPDQRAWDSLGLLEYGITMERNALGYGPSKSEDDDDTG